MIVSLLAAVAILSLVDPGDSRLPRQTTGVFIPASANNAGAGEQILEVVAGIRAQQFKQPHNKIDRLSSHQIRIPTTRNRPDKSVTRSGASSAARGDDYIFMDIGRAVGLRGRMRFDPGTNDHVTWCQRQNHWQRSTRSRERPTVKQLETTNQFNVVNLPGIAGFFSVILARQSRIWGISVGKPQALSVASRSRSDTLTPKPVGRLSATLDAITLLTARQRPLTPPTDPFLVAHRRSGATSPAARGDTRQSRRFRYPGDA